MQLNYPRLALPDAPETVAFRAIDAILRTDPTITSLCQVPGAAGGSSGGGGLYLSWTGQIEDVWEPSATTCPFLRISPGGLGSSWETEGQHRMPMAIAIEAGAVLFGSKPKSAATKPRNQFSIRRTASMSQLQRVLSSSVTGWPRLRSFVIRGSA